MWKHWCPEEKAWISVGEGQPCNWCEKTPPALPPDTETGQNTPIQE